VAKTAAQQPTTEEVAGALRLAVLRLSRRLRRENTIGLSPTLGAVLGTIARDGPITMGAVAATEGLAPPSITKAAARLVDEGLITRRVDDVDRRIVWLELTADGRRRLDATRYANTRWLADRLEGCTPGELASLREAAALLERMVEETRRP
jgi:DNA-binding MarR family transcriptional regulator